VAATFSILRPRVGVIPGTGKKFEETQRPLTTCGWFLSDRNSKGSILKGGSVRDGLEMSFQVEAVLVIVGQ